MIDFIRNEQRKELRERTHALWSMRELLAPALSKTFARKLVLTSTLRGKKQKLCSAESNYKSKHEEQGTETNDLFVKFLSLADVFHVHRRPFSTIFLWKPTCPSWSEDQHSNEFYPRDRLPNSFWLMTRGNRFSLGSHGAERGGNGIFVSQGNARWQIMVSALFPNVTTRYKPIAIELTFSSPLFCLPFSTSPSDAMLVWDPWALHSPTRPALLQRHFCPFAWKWSLRALNLAWQNLKFERKKNRGPGT